MKKLFDPRHLGAFSLLARTRSFTQAAVEAQLTQSAISHSIRHLERQVGCRLFDRTSRRVTLTQAGEQFLFRVERITEEMAAARAELQNVKVWGQTELRIAAPATLCEALLPRTLQNFRVEYPHSVLSVVVADRHEAPDRLRSGDADLAIALGPAPDDRFEYAPLFSDELFFTTLPEHPWVEHPPESKAVIGSQPLVSYLRRSHTWKVINDHFAVDEINLTVAVECESMSVIKELVKLGVGVGILARWVVAGELERKQLACVSLGKKRLIRSWGVLSLATRRLSLAETIFIDFARRIASALPGGLPTPDLRPAKPESRSFNQKLSSVLAGEHHLIPALLCLDWTGVFFF
jgi:DNA-binding transcriptional LysR family regulator